MKAPTISVLHIEDDPLWGEAIGKMLSDWPEIENLGIARTGAEGFALCRDLHPAVILLDLWLPDVDGLKILDDLTCFPHVPRVLLLSCRADDATFYRAATGRVHGLIWKSSQLASSLRQAIYVVSSGSTYYPSNVCEAIRRFRCASNAFHKILSPRELELLTFFGRGETDVEIADRLLSAVSTIHCHRTNIMRKLNLHRTEDLMGWCLDRGIVTHLRRTCYAEHVIGDSKSRLS